MAVYRPTPTCYFCGKPIAKAIHKSYKGVPTFLIPIGDSFIRWEYKECKCEGARKARKQAEAKQKKWLKDNNVTFEKLFEKKGKKNDKCETNG